MNGTNFIKQGIEVVSEAIQADKDEDYERALQLYKRALEVFMTGVKYEKNPAARATNAATWPTYSRELSDPVPGGAELEPRHALVLCEGNYLLLGKLNGAEAERWRPLRFDESWFVRPQGGVEEQRNRVVERHLETWTDAKTEAWGAASAREGAEKRADSNDVPNAYLVDQCRAFADLEVESL